MKTILVVDDMAILRDPIAASLRLAGYQTSTAGGGREAIERIVGNPPDLLLLDLSMPEVDGLAVVRFLKTNRKLANIPVILLTAVSDKQSIVEAAQLGIREYVLKTHFSLSDLLSRVSRNLDSSVSSAPDASQPAKPAASPLDQSASPAGAKPASAIPQLLTRDDCIARAQRALESKTLSGVVAQVISLTASPRADASQISELISRDPMLSARILHAANSPAYISNKGVVTTIPEAIRNIGFTTVRNIATAMGIFDAMPETSDDGFNPIRCWQHSFAVAQICERLQNMVDPAQAGIAYLVGLCHDLGEILFHTHFAKEYKQVLAQAQQTGKSRRDLERAMLGISHGELIRIILQQIGLPEAIRIPVEDAHRVGLHGDSNDPLARILIMAELYANGTQLASSCETKIAPLTQALCKQAVGKPDPERPDGPMLRGEVVSLTALLARLSVNEQKQLIAPLLSATDVRIRLVRDVSFSSFDPVAAALESICKLTVSTALPAQDELGQIDGIVVVAPSTSSPRMRGTEIEVITRTAANLPLWWLVNQIDQAPPAHCQPTILPVTLQAMMDYVLRAKSPTARAA